MFSHLTSDRFDEKAELEHLGPGSYDKEASAGEVEHSVSRQRTRARDTPRSQENGAKENRRENRMSTTPARPSTPGRPKTPTRGSNSEDADKLKRQLVVLQEQARDDKLEFEQKARVVKLEFESNLATEQKRASALQQQLNELQGSLKQAGEQLAQSDQNAAKATTRLTEQTEQNAVYQGEICELQGALSAAQEAYRTAQEILGSQGSDDLAVRVAEMQRAVAIAQDREKELDAQLVLAGQELEAYKFTAESKIEDLRDELQTARILGEERSLWEETKAELTQCLAAAQLAAADSREGRSELESSLTATQERVSELEERLESSIQEAIAKEDELQTDLSAVKDVVDERDSEVQRLLEEIEHLKAEAQLVESDKDKIARQEEELHDLDKSSEELKLQNRQMLATVQQFKLEKVDLMAENKELKESLGIFEADLERESKANAQLAGHNNHKQKIQMFAKTKNQLNESRDECEKLRQRIAALEARTRGSDGLTDLLADFRGNGVTEAPTPARAGRVSTSGMGARTPGRSTTASGVGRTHRRDIQTELSGEETTEVQRKCRLHERNAEKIHADFLHFTCLIESAVASASEDLEGNGQEPLLDRLRKLAARPSTEGK